MSPGEAEFYAGIKGAAEGLGMQSLLKDLGCEVQVRLHQDSIAARGVNSRIGISKIKHLEARLCWIQEAARKKRIFTRKILGLVNPADILTKPISATEAKIKCALVGFDLIIKDR